MQFLACPMPIFFGFSLLFTAIVPPKTRFHEILVNGRTEGWSYRLSEKDIHYGEPIWKCVGSMSFKILRARKFFMRDSIEYWVLSFEREIITKRVSKWFILTTRIFQLHVLCKFSFNENFGVNVGYCAVSRFHRHFSTWNNFDCEMSSVRHRSITAP